MLFLFLLLFLSLSDFQIKGLCLVLKNFSYKLVIFRSNYFGVRPYSGKWLLKCELLVLRAHTHSFTIHGQCRLALWNLEHINIIYKYEKYIFYRVSNRYVLIGGGIRNDYTDRWRN